jgi:hypothetical protein
MRRDTSGEAEGDKHSGRLTLSPLGDSEDGKVIGQERGNGEGEDRREGKATTVRATRVGDARKGGEQFEG